MWSFVNQVQSSTRLGLLSFNVNKNANTAGCSARWLQRAHSQRFLHSVFSNMRVSSDCGVLLKLRWCSLECAHVLAATFLLGSMPLLLSPAVCVVAALPNVHRRSSRIAASQSLRSSLCAPQLVPAPVLWRLSAAQPRRGNQKTARVRQQTASQRHSPCASLHSHSASEDSDTLCHRDSSDEKTQRSDDSPGATTRASEQRTAWKRSATHTTRIHGLCFRSANLAQPPAAHFDSHQHVSR